MRLAICRQWVCIEAGEGGGVWGEGAPDPNPSALRCPAAPDAPPSPKKFFYPQTHLSLSLSHNNWHTALTILRHKCRHICLGEHWRWTGGRLPAKAQGARAKEWSGGEQVRAGWAPAPSFPIPTQDPRRDSRTTGGRSGGCRRI